MPSAVGDSPPLARACTRARLAFPLVSSSLACVHGDPPSVRARGELPCTRPLMLGTPPTQSQEPRQDPARSECNAAHSRRDRCGVPPRAWLLGGEQLWPCPLAVPLGLLFFDFICTRSLHSFSAARGHSGPRGAPCAPPRSAPCACVRAHERTAWRPRQRRDKCPRRCRAPSLRTRGRRSAAAARPAQHA